MNHTQNKMKTILLPVAALLLAACSPTAKQDSATPAATAAVPAPVAEPAPEATAAVDAETGATSMPNHSSFNGIITVSPQRHATVTLTMGGTVHNTSLLPGHYVKKGDVLATLENPDFIDLQERYLDGHAQMEFIEADYNRQMRLSQEEASSVKRFQQSKSEYLAMRCRIDSDAARLALLGVEPKEVRIKGIRPYLEVKSPISGYVSALSINLGKYVEAGQPLCDVVDKSETLLCLTAYEKDLQDLVPGKRVQFRVNGMGEQTFNATLISVGQVINETSRSLEVYARVKEQNDRFRPGMYVTAHVEK